jgi:hypothetical protein
MSNKEVVEVIYGKYHKYEVVKTTSLLSSPSFSIYRDGKYFKGSYDSLAAAVEAARREG